MSRIRSREKWSRRKLRHTWQNEAVECMKAFERDLDAPSLLAIGSASYYNEGTERQILGAFQWPLREMIVNTRLPLELGVFNNIFNIGYLANNPRLKLFYALLSRQAKDQPQSLLERSALAPTTVLDIGGSLCLCWVSERECSEQEWFEIDALVRASFGDSSTPPRSPEFVVPLPGFDVVFANADGSLTRTRVEALEINPSRRYTPERMLEAFASGARVRPEAFQQSF
jgi:hypothetical protein